MLPVVRRTWDDDDVPALRDDEELLELPRTWLEEEPLLTWLDDEVPELRTCDEEDELRTWLEDELEDVERRA